MRWWSWCSVAMPWYLALLSSRFDDDLCLAMWRDAMLNGGIIYWANDIISFEYHYLLDKLTIWQFDINDRKLYPSHCCDIEMSWLAINISTTKLNSMWNENTDTVVHKWCHDSGFLLLLAKDIGQWTRLECVLAPIFVSWFVPSKRACARVLFFLSLWPLVIGLREPRLRWWALYHFYLTWWTTLLPTC